MEKNQNLSQDQIDQIMLSVPQETVDRYYDALKNAWRATKTYDGSECAMDRVIDAFDGAEKIVREANNGKVSIALEKEFSYYADFDGTVADVMMRGVKKFYEGMADKTTQDQLAMLKNAGANITYNDKTLILSDSGQINKNGSGNGKVEHKTQPHLAWLIETLAEEGIYADQLNIHIGKVDPKMMRKEPYIVVDISHFNKQIAVCNEYGQTTFVSKSIKDPEIYETKTKKELLGYDDIGTIILSTPKSWQNHIKDFLQNRSLKSIFANKVDKKHITLDMIETVCRAYADDPKNDGRSPPAGGEKGKEIIPYEPLVKFNMTWVALNLSMHKKSNGLTEENCSYDSIPDLCKDKGIGLILNVDMIEEVCRAYADDPKNNGRSPPSGGSKTKEIIPYEPLARFNMTWASLNMSMVQKSNGLTDENCPYKSIPDLCKDKGIGKKNQKITLQPISKTAAPEPQSP